MLTILMMLKTNKLGLKSFKKWFLKTGTRLKVKSCRKNLFFESSQIMEFLSRSKPRLFYQHFIFNFSFKIQLFAYWSVAMHSSTWNLKLEMKLYPSQKLKMPPPLSFCILSFENLKLFKNGRRERDTLWSKMRKKLFGLWPLRNKIPSIPFFLLGYT